MPGRRIALERAAMGATAKCRTFNTFTLGRDEFHQGEASAIRWTRKEHKLQIRRLQDGLRMT